MCSAGRLYIYIYIYAFVQVGDSQLQSMVGEGHLSSCNDVYRPLGEKS